MQRGLCGLHLGLDLRWRRPLPAGPALRFDPRPPSRATALDRADSSSLDSPDRAALHRAARHLFVRVGAAAAGEWSVGLADGLPMTPSQTDAEIEALIVKISIALSDPRSPWYGSDVVSWTADLIDAYRARLDERRELRAEDRVLRGLVQTNPEWKCPHGVLAHDGQPLREMGFCPLGFPGCGCADDRIAVLCEDEERIVSKLRERVRELEADRERLDWLCDELPELAYDEDAHEVVVRVGTDYSNGADIRAAIDAAREREEGKK